MGQGWLGLNWFGPNDYDCPAVRAGYGVGDAHIPHEDRNDNYHRDNYSRSRPKKELESEKSKPKETIVELSQFTRKDMGPEFTDTIFNIINKLNGVIEILNNHLKQSNSSNSYTTYT